MGTSQSERPIEPLGVAWGNENIRAANWLGSFRPCLVAYQNGCHQSMARSSRDKFTPPDSLGKPVPFEHRHERYMNVAEVMVTLASASFCAEFPAQPLQSRVCVFAYSLGPLRALQRRIHGIDDLLLRTVPV
jgi:hypothetical protein